MTLGDSAYPHEPWMMTPEPNAYEGTPECVYTALHCQARNCAERCNGVLKGQSRCLYGDRVLHYRPAKAGRIANACAVLHNYCILKEHPHLPQEFGDDDIYYNDCDVEALDRDHIALVELADYERRYLKEYAVDRMWL